MYLCQRIKAMRYKEQILAFLHRHHMESITPVAALIDMDGTLYDSMKNHAAAWKRMTDEIGMNIPYDEFFLFEGMTGAATIELLFQREFNRNATDDEKEQLYKLKTEYFKELPAVKPMPGASTLLNEMKDMGMTRVLVTGSGQKSLIDRLSADFPDMFSPELMVTSRNVTKGKPHPEPYIKGMQLAGVGPKKSIVVENAPLGVKAGDRAGAFTIGITTGPIPADELTKAGAAVVFGSMTEFADEFPQLMLEIFNTSVENSVIY